MKIAAVVTLYHPTDEEIQNITTYINQVAHVYIFDNTEGKGNQDLLLELNPEDYTYYWEDNNLGISAVMNKALGVVYTNQYDFLLCMDQDSRFLKENLTQYFKEIEKKENQNVALFGLSISKDDKLPDLTTEIEENTILITAGSILNLKIFKQYNINFDENLFIDVVDFDICFNLLSKGLRIIQLKNIYMVHTVGSLVKKATYKTLFLIKRVRQIHPPLRIYYMYRNTLYIKDKYINLLPDQIKQFCERNMQYIKTSYLYADDKKKMKRAIKKAKFDYKNKIFGKINGTII